MKVLFSTMCRFRLLIVSAMVLTFWGAIAEAQSPHPSDTSQDWAVSDFELLDYIDQWAARQVDDFDLLDTIDFWAAGEYYWDESSQKHVAGHAIADLLTGTWVIYHLEGIPPEVGGPSGVNASNSQFVFNANGTYSWFFHFDVSPFFFDLSTGGNYTLTGSTLCLDGMSEQILLNDCVPIVFTDNNNRFSFADDEGDRWYYEKMP